MEIRKKENKTTKEHLGGGLFDHPYAADAVDGDPRRARFYDHSADRVRQPARLVL